MRQLAKTQRFRDDIQGLRALAIVPVVLYHSHRSWAPGGYVGVDIFFVISGYLITGIILGEIARDRYSVIGFYERRIKRLFPALFLLLTATTIAGLALLPPPQLAKLGGATIAALLFVANLFYLQQADYFAEAAEYLPLIHTWSLAVEEQFYIAFPLLVFALRRRPRLLLGVTAAGAALSLIACVWLLDRSASAAFYLPFTRAYELLIGAGIAIALPRFAATQPVRDAMSVAGLALIAYAIAAFDHATRFPGMAALIPCIGTALVLVAGQGGTSRGGRLISAAPFVFFGNISYSLYLWHWPVLAFGRYAVIGPLGAGQAAALVALATALAWLSWRLVERPVIAGAHSRRAIFGAALGGAAIITLAGAALMLSGGFPARFGEGARAAQSAAQAGFSPHRAACHYRHDRPFDYAASCVLGQKGAAPTQAVWADSFGAELAHVLAERAGQRGESLRQLTASACAPGLDAASPSGAACTRFNAAALAGLADEPTIRTVTIAVHYLAYDIPADAYTRRLGAIVGRLRAAGKQVVLVYPVPLPRFDVPTGLAMAAQRGRPPSTIAGDHGEFRRQSAAIRRGLDRIVARTGAIAIIPERALCPGGQCRVTDVDGAALYFDDRHLSLRGVALLIDTPAALYTP